MSPSDATAMPHLATLSIPGLDHLPEGVGETLIIQGIQTGGALVILLASWVIGQRVLNYWEFQKKIRESDLESERAFQKLHGEFKTLWRLWKIHAKRSQPAATGIDDDRTWDLVDRAAAVEGELEALLLKLASNRALTPDDCRDLGLLRQLVQQIREGIKRGSALDESFRRADYDRFHHLTAVTLEILRRRPQFQPATRSERNMKAILAIRPEALEDARSGDDN